MEFTDILYEKKEHVAWITINRPERYNATDANTFAELATALEDAGLDGKIGVVVLTGAGDKAFCAGGYLADLTQFNVRMGRLLFGHSMKTFDTIRRIPQPVIAAVNGYAVGGGNELVVACDLAIASDRAKFGQTGPKVGSSPVFGGTNLQALIIGEKKAREVCYLCRLYDAYEAERLGWVNKVVPHEKLYEEVQAWCEELLDKSPAYLEVTKATSNIWWDLLAHSFSLGSQALLRLAGSDEMTEGATAFMQKRKPDFRRFRR